MCRREVGFVFLGASLSVMLLLVVSTLNPTLRFTLVSSNDEPVATCFVPATLQKTAADIGAGLSRLISLLLFPKRFFLFLCFFLSNSQWQ